MKNSLRSPFLSLLAISVVVGSRALAQTAAPKLIPLGTSEVLGKVNGLAIEAKVQSPSGQVTPLQIVCVFEYTEGDIFNSPPALPPELNGLWHVDQALNGLITDLRKSGRFAGHACETLLRKKLQQVVKAIGRIRVSPFGLKNAVLFVFMSHA